MKSIAATEAKNRFGELLESVHQGPMEIAKKGRAVAVMLSVADYRQLQQSAAAPQKQTNQGWLKEWRKGSPAIASTSAMDEKDYGRHLESRHK